MKALVGIAGVVATLAGILSTYLLTRRKMSGRIATSEASTLWSEGQAMRKELRDEAAQLRAEVATLRRETVTMRSAMNALQVEIVHLRDENHRLIERVETLSARLGDPDRHHNQRRDDSE